MRRELKDKKKAIWPQFLVTCGAFALFDLGHTFKEVDNMISLQLPKFRWRQYDPLDIIKNFTTMAKIKVFTKEDDIFDDVFWQKISLKEILHIAQIQFDQAKLQEFNHYREQRLENVPLDKLHIELIREPTPSISISGSSGEEKSKSKCERESIEKSDKQSKSEHSRSEGSIKDTTQSIENPDQ